MILTPHQAQYLAYELTRVAPSNSVDKLAAVIADAQVDLNPHQVDAALFACRNPLSQGVILADEVGLGKTVEAGLVIAQHWAERKRKILVIVPANLRKQWHQELLDKFALDALILEAKSYNQARRDGRQNPFDAQRVVICSYQFAKAKIADVKAISWDLSVLDEAHRLRNVYKTGNVIGRALKEGLAGVHSKVLLTATPLQNSLLELYGLVSLIDERIFGDLDSFRTQFAAITQSGTFDRLRERIAPICKRTLRRNVAHTISYTHRIALVEQFSPGSDEQELRNLVAEYLRRADLKALPNSQRQLITLVLWKLLASSTHAIGGAMGTMAARLEKLLADPTTTAGLDEELEQDYEALDDEADEWEEPQSEALSESDRAAIRAEIDELRGYEARASQIRDNAKGSALLTALEKAFAELDRLGAPRKALIFTESRRTQEYLVRLLNDTPFGQGLVLFNGTNTGKDAQKIYKDWVAQHAGSDRVSGSKTADTRAALVDYFRDQGQVMIATEAGAEGINLQFCSLVINYDLPWNPQRIEQRIGRCHRYGQKFDVVVVNFVDLTNEADRRVYELLDKKFQLFSGVFGASDEVLGSIGSGVDFERRIAEIYQRCRDTDTIQASFDQLQADLAGEISEAMVRTRDVLLSNFDEKVLERIRAASIDSRSRHEGMLLQLTRHELQDYADFSDDGSFALRTLPKLAPPVPLGRYELPRRSGDAHLYRLGHPLGEFVIQSAKARSLEPAHLVINYVPEAGRISTLEPYRGRQGHLQVSLLSVESLGGREEHLLVSAVTDDGVILQEEDPRRLLRLPTRTQYPAAAFAPPPALLRDIEERKNAILQSVNEQNLKYFEQEIQKLDNWADDLKVGLEQEIKAIDREIKEARRAATTAPDLQTKLEKRKQQGELENKRSRLRRELFERQDAVDAERNRLIASLEGLLAQKVTQTHILGVAWELIK